MQPLTMQADVPRGLLSRDWPLSQVLSSQVKMRLLSSSLSGRRQTCWSDW